MEETEKKPGVFWSYSAAEAMESRTFDNMLPHFIPPLTSLHIR